MAKKDKKTRPSTQTWLNDNLQVALDGMLAQGLQPSEDACLMVTTDLGLIVGTHRYQKVDASIFIPLARVPFVTHAFQRVIQSLDFYPPEVKAMFPKGRPVFPGEQIVEGRAGADGTFTEAPLETFSADGYTKAPPEELGGGTPRALSSDDDEDNPIPVPA